MAQVLAWAVDHDAGIALRLAVALAPWWFLRGRLAGQYVAAGRRGRARRAGQRRVVRRPALARHDGEVLG